MLSTLDIESYGACADDLFGHPLPEQTIWNPERSLVTDSIERDRLVLSTALTFPVSPESFGPAPTIPALRRLQPQSTSVFLLQDPKERQYLLDWLSRITIVVGHYVGFDIMYLRALGADFRALLQPSRLFLICTGVINYLSDEDRKERSLKALCRLFNIHTYKRTLADGLFPNPRDPDFQQYNGLDTSNDTKLAALLSQEIVETYGEDSPKCQPSCLQFFNDCLWGAIRYNEAGLPMSRSALERLGLRYKHHADYARQACQARWGLKLGGKNSQKTQRRFIDGIIADTSPPGYASLEEAERLGIKKVDPHPILDHNCLERSKELKRVSWTNLNRDLFRGVLPPDDNRRQALLLANEETFAAKMNSTFILKLLHHKSKHPEDTRDKLLPCTTRTPRPLNPDTYIGYPIVRIIPMPSKERDDDDRGQRQVRPSWTYPPAQTFHKSIRQYQSRWHDGVILSWDQSQHELRTAGVLSHDPHLVKVFTDGLDPHAETAKVIWGESIVDHPRFKSLHRQAAKHSNFEMLNLGGADTLQHTILDKSGFLYPLTECQRLVASRRMVYPDLAWWQETIVQQAQRDGFLTLPITGHSRCFLGVSEPQKIVNFPIQGIAAATVWAILHRVFDKCLPDMDLDDPLAFPILNHYDAGLFDCRDAATANWIKSETYSAMKWVEQSGYWALICDHYGAFIPLEGEATIIRPTA